MHISKKKLPLVAVVITVVLAIGTMAFSKNKNLASNYWVYNSSTTSNFNDTSKYVLVSLISPDDENCQNGDTRPCVYKEAVGSISTKAGLYNQINSLSDFQILNNSEVTKP